MDTVPLLTKPTRLWRDKTDFFKPFRRAAKDTAAGENIRPLFDPDLAHTHVETDTELLDLNNALQTLVEVFPDVEPEVFREMLTSISEESRIAVVTEQMLKKNAKITVKERARRLLGRQKEILPRKSVQEYGVLSVEDTFRGEKYHEAVKNLLYQEFRSLSHSTIKGVMAENNSSYTRCRPVLQILASKTWRLSIASFWSRTSTVEDTTSHPAVLWSGSSTIVQPSIKSTGNVQLDCELYDLLARPVIERNRQQQLASDHTVAIDLNEAEAIEVGATYDCECCYSTVAFEQIATCDTGEHMLCFDCVRRTTTEALYGQGWARSADLEKSTIRCFAPALKECQASIASQFVKRALQEDFDNVQIWPDFSRRITSEVLIKSRVSLQRCPFCTYAEVDETPTALLRRPGQIREYYTKELNGTLHPRLVSVVAGSITGLILGVMACTILLVGTLACFFGIVLFIQPSSIPPVQIGPLYLVGPLAATATTALNRVYKRRRGLKFRCEEPKCKRTSCTRCLAEWRDPHVCFDNEKTSLRTAIEASATAAVKRTCPHCHLSFVKASGCNKLVCNCGYTMCYVCRSEITAKEGYAHFCQHFRPAGGRCTECDRCDLYGDQDEEAAIRRAAELAEREWREKEAAKNKSQADSGDALAARAMVEAVIGHGKQAPWQERWLDAVLEVFVAFKHE